ncbi:hypothetical protein ScPMuIL_002582 [Solemya velum]
MGLGDDKERTLWVGNLSDQVTEDILFELFLQVVGMAGPLNKVTIAKDKDGRSKSYAFIDFKHECSVPYTMKLMEGIKLFRKPLNLQARTGSSQTQSPAQQYNSPGAVDFKSPPFHRSNTWHGDNLSSSESQYRQRGYEGQRNYGDSGQYNRSPSSSPRHVASSHSGWFGDSNSPEQGAQRSTRDSYDNQRQRILQSQNTMIDAHRQQQSSYRHQPYSSAERRPWNQQQSQTQQQYWRRH